MFWGRVYISRKVLHFSIKMAVFENVSLCGSVMTCHLCRILLLDLLLDKCKLSLFGFLAPWMGPELAIVRAIIRLLWPTLCLAYVVTWNTVQLTGNSHFLRDCSHGSAKTFCWLNFLAFYMDWRVVQLKVQRMPHDDLKKPHKQIVLLSKSHFENCNSR